MSERSRELLNRLFKETLEKRATLIEAFVVKYLQDTSLDVTEIELVERNDGDKLVWYFRKKGSDV